MILHKWNYNTRKYEDYEIPDSWNVKTYCDDWHERVNCANCGKLIRYADSYTSMEIHTDMGIGYAVCDECNKIELNKRNAGKRNNRLGDRLISVREAYRYIDAYTSKANAEELGDLMKTMIDKVPTAYDLGARIDVIKDSSFTIESFGERGRIITLDSVLNILLKGVSNE